MTNLLLKTKTELFKWLSEREREREREREKLQGSIFLPLFQFNTPVFFQSMFI